MILTKLDLRNLGVRYRPSKQQLGVYFDRKSEMWGHIYRVDGKVFRDFSSPTESKARAQMRGSLNQRGIEGLTRDNILSDEELKRV